ncbi:MAG: HAMP domain-containing protein [Deltaproteobacteria bacterium]|nr:HAMP domain-containing protein [Deltaproteobacteria bacterium]
METTLPTVLVVAAATLLSTGVLGEIFARTHEEHSEENVHNLAIELDAALGRAKDTHTSFEGILRAAGAASGKGVAVASPNGEVRFASDDGLKTATLSMVEDRTIVTRAGEHYTRRVFSLRASPRCTGCHSGEDVVGLLSIDVPRERAEKEVRDQQRTNLLAGAVLALVLSLTLAGIQLVLLHRPLRNLRRAIERIRSGDLDARATVVRPDEIGELAGTLNEMAEALAHARTELDRTHRAELAQSEKLASLGELTSAIAHEIKNPLAGIIGVLRVLESEAGPLDPNKEILGKVLGQTERLSRTAVELLDFARPLRPTLQQVDACDIVDRALFFVERQASEQKVELRRKYATGLSPVLVDPDLMKQVFLNLVINGIQAMPSGGVLELDVRESAEGAIEVAVLDQGIGISDENQKRLFSPFFSTKPKGTGLGLYVAKQLVETQRGEIRVSSRLGEGTTFTVRLPALKARRQEGSE